MAVCGQYSLCGQLPSDPTVHCGLHYLNTFWTCQKCSTTSGIVSFHTMEGFMYLNQSFPSLWGANSCKVSERCFIFILYLVVVPHPYQQRYVWHILMGWGQVPVLRKHALLTCPPHAAFLWPHFFSWLTLMKGCTLASMETTAPALSTPRSSC